MEVRGCNFCKKKPTGGKYLTAGDDSCRSDMQAQGIHKSTETKKKSHSVKFNLFP